MKHTVVLTALCAILAASSAWAEKPPASAHKATLDEFKTLADGKTVAATIYDAGQPVTATLVWSWKKKNITGSASVGGKKIKVKTKLSFKGDQACAVDGGKTKCHAIFIDGAIFYEVKDDGEVHAKSVVQ